MTWKHVGWALIGLLLAWHLLYLAMIAAHINATGFTPKFDFTVFWAAAKLALAGEAVAAFDWRVLERAQGIEPGGSIYYWYYPPLFHLLITPLGLLPFLAAHALFTLGGLLLFALALRAWSTEHAWIALASPAVLFTLLTGNATLYWAAALLAAFRLLERPLLSGLLLSAMTAKPQLGLVVPVALLAARSWRVILWGALWTAVVVVVTLWIFGAGYWATFFRNLVGESRNITGAGAPVAEMMSWYACLRMFGVPHDVALSLHLVVLGFTGWAVAVAWGRDDVNLRMAVLCLAIPLATPYAFPYELVMAAMSAMFLVVGGRAQAWTGLVVVLLLWSVPAWPWLAGPWFFGGIEPAHVTAPVLTLALGWLMLQRSVAPAA